MSSVDKRQLKERGMSDDEAERVLERAAKLQAEREGGRHSTADLKAGAAEVGIDPALIDEAKRQLEREARDEQARARKTKRVALLSGGVVAGVLVLGTLATHVSLNDKLAEVERREAQLENVLERRRALVPQLLSLARAQALGASERAKALEQLGREVEADGPLPDQLAADARIADGMRALHEEVARTAGPGQETLVLRIADEMAGAQNRISVERKRYDEAVSEYNRAARAIPRAWFRPLTGMPANAGTGGAAR